MCLYIIIVTNYIASKVISKILCANKKCCAIIIKLDYNIIARKPKERERDKSEYFHRKWSILVPISTLHAYSFQPPTKWREMEFFPTFIRLKLFTSIVYGRKYISNWLPWIISYVHNIELYRLVYIKAQKSFASFAYLNESNDAFLSLILYDCVWLWLCMKIQASLHNVITSPFYNRIVYQGYISLMMIEICVFGYAASTSHSFLGLDLDWSLYFSAYVCVCFSVCHFNVCECLCARVALVASVFVSNFLFFLLQFFGWHHYG